MTPLDRDRGLNAVNARTFAHPDEDRAARAIADLLVNQLVHGDLVMFTRGGGPADRELLITALQGGDLDEAAVRSQWTGEH